MKIKQLIILALILGALALAVFVRSQQETPGLAVHEYASLELAVPEQDVARIFISKASDQGQTESVELLKDKEWRLASLWDAAVNISKVEQFLAELPAITGEVRAADASLYPDFGITSEEAIHFIFSDASGNTLRDFYIGTQKASYDSLFIRQEGSPEVYLSKSQILNRIGLFGAIENADLNPDFWAKLTLSFFQTIDIKSLILDSGKGKPISMTRDIPEGGEEEKWRFLAPHESRQADTAKAGKYLGTLFNARMQKVLNPSENTLETVENKITLQMRSGEEVHFEAGNYDEDKKTYVLWVSNQPAPYLLSEYYANLLFVDVEHFIQEEVDEEGTKEA